MFIACCLCNGEPDDWGLVLMLLFAVVLFTILICAIVIPEAKYDIKEKKEKEKKEKEKKEQMKADWTKGGKITEEELKEFFKLGDKAKSSAWDIAFLHGWVNSDAIITSINHTDDEKVSIEIKWPEECNKCREKHVFPEKYMSMSNAEVYRCIEAERARREAEYRERRHRDEVEELIRGH